MGARGHLTYANVMATLAVVIAIGGGIAIAGKKDKGLPVNVWQGSAALDANESETLVRVPKLGTFTALRGNQSSGGITFKNTSGVALRLTYLGGNVTGTPGDNTFAEREEVAPGETTSFGSTSTNLYFDMMIAPLDADKQNPLAQVSLQTAGVEHRVIVAMPPR